MVAFLQGLVEGGIACTRVSPIANERAINDQGGSAGQQLGGFFEDGIRAAGWTDVQQVDANHSVQCPSDRLGKGPGLPFNIKVESFWHHRAQTLVLDPGVDAGAMVWIRIAGLPEQMGETLLKADGMLTTAAGQFQHSA